MGLSQSGRQFGSKHGKDVNKRIKTLILYLGISLIYVAYLYHTTFPPTVPTSAAGIPHVVADVEAPGGEKWEHLKSGGKQWQTTPKNLPRMQLTRAIPVA